MNNRTYICTACRTAKRAEAAYWLPTSLRCHLCRGPLWELSQRWRIPAKGNVREWEELARMVRDEAPRREELLLKWAAAQLKSMNRQIQRLTGRSKTGRRSISLTRLRAAREQLIRQHFPEGAATE